MRRRKRRVIKIVKKKRDDKSITQDHGEETSGIVNFCFHENKDRPIYLRKSMFEREKQSVFKFIFGKEEEDKEINLYIQPKDKYFVEELAGDEISASFDLDYAKKNKILVNKSVQQFEWKILTKKEITSLELDLVIMTFKNQYISLKDISEIEKDMLSSQENYLMTTNEKLHLKGFDLEIKQLYRKNEPVNSGVLKKDKTFIKYLSITSNLKILLEISKETLMNRNGELVLHQ